MVKKLKNVWGKIIEKDNIAYAYKKAKKGKNNLHYLNRYDKITLA